MAKLRFAMICSSNQNRSMEAHAVLQAAGFDVSSYGTGARVKLPGESADTPNVYEFGTSYSFMLQDLKTKAEDFYKKRGLIQMLERNQAIKTAPERWQSAQLSCDVAMTFEERVMDAVVDNLLERSGVKPLLLINMDVVDSHEAAAKAGPLVLELCKKLEETTDPFEELDRIVDDFQDVAKKRVLYDVGYY